MRDGAAVQRALMGGGTLLVGALVLWSWLPESELALSAGPSAARASALSASPLLAPQTTGPFAAASPAKPAVAQATPWPRLALFGAAAAVPIRIAAPQKLQVGEFNELVVSTSSAADIADIGFTVQFDPNVLQVRAGTEGDWAAGLRMRSRFTAEISGAEDRVQVHSMLTGRRPSTGGGSAASTSIALLQFQAVAPGNTWVMISDLTVKDAAGNALAFSLSASTLQVSAESLPSPGQWSAQPRSAVAGAAPEVESIERGD